MTTKKAMAIAIERDDDKMTIALVPNKTKARGISYYGDGWKYSKATAELLVQSYISREALVDGATVFLDKRLVDNFPIVTDSPFKGEFKLVYTDENGQPIKAAKLQEPPRTVTTTPYHVEIKMFGDKIPLFTVCINDSYLARNKKFNTTFRAKELNEWIIALYQRRKEYANFTIEIPKVIAALYLDIFSINPKRIIDELNVTLTEEPANLGVEELQAIV